MKKNMRLTSNHVALELVWSNPEPPKPTEYAVYFGSEDSVAHIYRHYIDEAGDLDD